MSSPSILSTAEYYKLSLIAAGVDLADIPPILDTATWRHMMLAALYQISSGGGGGGYIDGVVDTYNDLPVTVGTPALNTVYLVRFGSGVWLINRHPAGLYIRIANNGTLADWEYLGTFPEVQSDLRWRVYNETDPTKEVALDVSNVTTGTLRTLGVPNASGRIQIEGQPIGDVSPSSGAFTTLSATGTATLPHIHGALAGNLYIHVKNVSGVQLSRGTPVYVVGNVGATDRVEVAAADFDDPTKMPAVGLLKQTLANNADGDAVIVGELDNADTSLYTLNQELFVGNNGAITGTRPTSGQIQSVGTVARVQSSTGVIVVNMQGTEFAFQSPPVIGSVTPNAGTFTNLVANTELQLPSAAPASPSAGDIYRSADQIRYRDSTGTTERILLNNLDNLANLGNTATARTNIGLGSASNVTFGSIQNTPIGSTTAAAITGTTGTFSTLSANNGTITASAPVLDLAQTWNNAAAAFTGIRLNVTNTASANTSDLLNLQIGGTTQFRIRGNTLFLDQFTLSGLYSPAPAYIGSTGALMCAGQFAVGNNLDTILIRDGASGTLAQRNGAAAQEYRIYGQYTTASNFERLSLKYNSTALAFQIGTEKGTGSPSGTARPLEFQTDGVTRMTIAATGSFGTVTINGVLANRALATNTWAAVDSLNSSGQQVGGFGYGGTGVSNFPDQMYFASVGKDLVLAIAANGTNNPIIVNGSTGLLSFYGKTNAFPALKRSSTTLQVRLADDSAFAPLTAGLITATGNLVLTDNDGAQTATFDAQSKLTANRTYDLPNASGTIALLETLPAGGPTNLWIPASAWIPRTTGGCGVDSREIGATNRANVDELLFDTGTEEFAQALVVMPSNYNNSTITARFYWTASSGSGGVAWGISGRAYGDDDALDQATGTRIVVTDTFITANDVHVTSATSAVTIDGTPAANKAINFQISREVGNASDTLGVDARLLGVAISFTSA